MIDKLRKDLKKLANSKKAKTLQRFFKTEKGEYGEGDICLGIIVPILRKIAIKYKGLSLKEISELLKSKIHEERMIALFILIQNYKKGDQKKKEEIYEIYLKNTKYINNWDLVDLSAGYIVGEYLLSLRGSPAKGRGDRSNLLLELAKSTNLWERRIAMISTFAFIYKKDPVWTFKIAEILISDKHDLIQKATGWMLREVGKRCGQEIEEDFLVRHYKRMSRTCLRYAIEHFDQDRRKMYLTGGI